MKKIILSLFFSFLILNAGEIRIAVAANVSYAMDDLKREFHKLYPDIKVQVVLGGSGKLTAQISHGAPYQIFMSANMLYPNSLYDSKVAITKPIIYARGGIVLLSNKVQDFSDNLELLKDSKISKIAIANPKVAPYGKAGLEAIKNSGIYDDIKDKLVYGESISQTLSYTIRATDIGIVAKSLLFSPKMSRFKEGKNWMQIDPTLYTPIDQGIVILKEGENSEDVELFYKFILGEKAKKIFKKFGYIVD